MNIEDDEIMELEDVTIGVGGHKAKRARKLTSTVWNFFDVVEEKNKKRTAKCKACEKVYAAYSKYIDKSYKKKALKKYDSINHFVFLKIYRYYIKRYIKDI